MTDSWAEGTFDGAATARMRRLAQLTPQQRLDWLEAALRDAEQTGLLLAIRRRRQQATLSTWRMGDGD